MFNFGAIFTVQYIVGINAGVLAFCQPWPGIERSPQVSVALQRAGTVVHCSSKNEHVCDRRARPQQTLGRHDSFSNDISTVL